MHVWRLGRKPTPCDFTPLKYCHWNHRFDDPRHKYRTLYCAKDPLTCIREVLADMRPNTKARAEFNRLFPGQQEELSDRVVVMPKWRKAHVLARAEIKTISGKWKNIDDMNLRRMLEDEFSELLSEHHMNHLDISEIRSKDREITRAISRALYERWDSAGIEFKSNLDDLPCYALFEGRAYLKPTAKAVSMTIDYAPLIKVCSEYNLKLHPMR